MKLYDLLEDMTFAVDRINGMRGSLLDERAAKLPAGDPLAASLRAASAQVDAIRKKIVATKEGGAITGEERLRENLARPLRECRSATRAGRRRPRSSAPTR